MQLRTLPHGSTHAAQDPSPLAGIAGLDLTEGLRLAMGREALYRRLLTHFVQGQSGALQHVANALARGDAEGAARAVHTLKGTSAQIAAPMLHEAARLWEAALRDGLGAAELAHAEARVAAHLGPLVRVLCQRLDIPVPEGTPPRA